MVLLFPVAKPRRSIDIISHETVVRTKPCNLRSDEEFLFSSEYRSTFDKGYCAVYEDALVVSKGSATRGMTSISQSVHVTRMNVVTRVKMHVRSACYLSMPHKIDAAMLVTDYVSSGYFHWIADVLPKVLLMQAMISVEYPDMPILLPDAYAKSYCTDTLALLGIRENRIILIPKRHKIRVKNLYAIGDILAPAGSGNFRPSLMKRIRSMAHQHVAHTIVCKNTRAKHEKKKRVYISRSDAAYRYLVNEYEILPILQEHDFMAVTLSHMSISEQIALFRVTDVLVSVHGAGLTNMLWMREGTHVAEIRRAGDAHNNCYFSLAHALNISYWYSLAYSNSDDTHKAHLVWELSSARNLIEQLVKKIS